MTRGRMRAQYPLPHGLYTLRHNLTVHERVYRGWGTDKWPMCEQKESIKHAMAECSMFKAAAAVIQHYLARWQSGMVSFQSGT